MRLCVVCGRAGVSAWPRVWTCPCLVGRHRGASQPSSSVPLRLSSVGAPLAAAAAAASLKFVCKFQASRWVRGKPSSAELYQSHEGTSCKVSLLHLPQHTEHRRGMTCTLQDERTRDTSRHQQQVSLRSSRAVASDSRRGIPSGGIFLVGACHAPWHAPRRGNPLCLAAPA